MDFTLSKENQKLSHPLLTHPYRQLNLRRRHRRHRSQHRPDRLRDSGLPRRQVRARSRHRIGPHRPAERGKEREIDYPSAVVRRDVTRNKKRRAKKQERLSSPFYPLAIFLPLTSHLLLLTHRPCAYVPTALMMSTATVPKSRRTSRRVKDLATSSR
jgi:hypothetical protein